MFTISVESKLQLLQWLRNYCKRPMTMNRFLILGLVTVQPPARLPPVFHLHKFQLFAYPGVYTYHVAILPLLHRSLPLDIVRWFNTSYRFVNLSTSPPLFSHSLIFSCYLSPVWCLFSFLTGKRQVQSPPTPRCKQAHNSEPSDSQTKIHVDDRLMWGVTFWSIYLFLDPPGFLTSCSHKPWRPTHVTHCLHARNTHTHIHTYMHQIYG